jgi:hypothetical protein
MNIFVHYFLGVKFSKALRIGYNLTLKFYILGEASLALLELGFVQFIPIMPFAFKLYMFSNFIIFTKKKIL